MTAKPKSEIMRETRQRRKEAGLIRVEVWVHPRDRERVKEYARKLQEQRK